VQTHEKEIAFYYFIKQLLASFNYEFLGLTFFNLKNGSDAMHTDLDELVIDFFLFLSFFFFLLFHLVSFFLFFLVYFPPCGSILFFFLVPTDVTLIHIFLVHAIRNPSPRGIESQIFHGRMQLVDLSIVPYIFFFFFFFLFSSFILSPSEGSNDIMDHNKILFWEKLIVDVLRFPPFFFLLVDKFFFLSREGFPV